MTPKARKELRYPPPDRLKILFPTVGTVNRVGKQVSIQFTRLHRITSQQYNL